jgi:oligopeptidase B
MPVPPAAARRPHSVTTHGHTRVDEFFWLRERENPEVIAYLEAENRYAEELTAHIAALRERLFAELVARVKETDETAPVRIGAHLYYSRTEAGRQYRVHCRRSDPGAPEQVLLDENLLAEGLPFFSLGTLRISPDERFLAYTTATTGGEVYDLFVRDVASGAVVDGPIRGVGEVEWGDAGTLFYTTYTDTWRSYRAFRHTLGAAQQGDALAYEERDPGLYLHISRSRSGAYLMLHSNSAQTCVARVVALDDPSAAVRQITPHTAGISYRAQHHGALFFVLTNDGAPEYRVLAAPLGDSSPAGWREVVPQRPGVSIDKIEVFDRFLAVYEREGGQERLRIHALPGGAEHVASFPETVYTLIWDADDSPWPLNPSFASGSLRLTYSSLVTPLQVLEYDVAARAFTTVKREEVPGYEASRYASERLWATAPDGVRVPISLVRRADSPPGDPRPCLLIGYGSYGSIEEPSFRASWLPLLERGFVCAIAHIRGGGELGDAWYRQGRVLTKKNTFTDFIACAEHLIAAGYTAPELLAIRGRSAGGLLMGAVVTMRGRRWPACRSWTWSTRSSTRPSRWWSRSTRSGATRASRSSTSTCTPTRPTIT